MCCCPFRHLFSKVGAPLLCADLPYGEAWTQGDVIGCALDLDAGTVAFARNGVHLGCAFEGIRRNVAYFPAVSLSYGEAATHAFLWS